MTEKQTQEITHEGGPRQYFHTMLNMADDDLSPYEYRLLGHYINRGVCWEAVRTTAKITQMSAGMVVKTRNALVDKKWIKTLPHDKDTIKIIVLDRWAENIARYSKRSPDEHGVHGVNGSVHGVKQTITIEEESITKTIKPPKKLSLISQAVLSGRFGITYTGPGEGYTKTQAGVLSDEDRWHKEKGRSPEDVTAFYQWLDRETPRQFWPHNKGAINRKYGEWESMPTRVAAQPQPVRVEAQDFSRINRE